MRCICANLAKTPLEESARSRTVSEETKALRGLNRSARGPHQTTKPMRQARCRGSIATYPDALISFFPFLLWQPQHDSPSCHTRGKSLFQLGRSELVNPNPCSMKQAPKALDAQRFVGSRAICGRYRPNFHASGLECRQNRKKPPSFPSPF
ncbi:hypothetical protein LZ31DRAFT_107211 [Colletotrichum somersetense]|nr:hypothetical protein LZ31DRAFT_107211 [Colletotrichum somersetense]